jgi:hypothetical protein
LDFEKFSWSNQGINYKKKLKFDSQLGKEIQNQGSNRKRCETTTTENDQIRGQIEEN